MTETAIAPQTPFVAGEEVLASPSRNYTPQPAIVVSCVVHPQLAARGITSVWVLTFRIVETGAEHAVQTQGRDYLATTGPGTPSATVIAPVLRPTAGELVDRQAVDFGPGRPSVMDVTTPELEAFGRALAAGSDKRAEGSDLHWQPVYVVTAGTDSRAPFTVAVCATQEAAGATALRFERLGVRIDVFALLT